MNINYSSVAILAQAFWPKQPYEHSTDPLRPALRLPG